MEMGNELHEHFVNSVKYGKKMFSVFKKTTREKEYNLLISELKLVLDKSQICQAQKTHAKVITVFVDT